MGKMWEPQLDELVGRITGKIKRNGRAEMALCRG
jgi:hypothetical protein